jgi:hypothetical protein
MAVLLAAGCSRQESAWRESQLQDNTAAYEAYLRDYPAGTHVAEAQARLAELRERQEWDRALRFDTPEAYQGYLARYPAGSFAAAARVRLSDFLHPRAPDQVESPPAAAPAPVAATAEQPSPAGPAASAVAAGGFRVQLGAFAGGEAAAVRAWERLLERHAGLLAGLERRVDVVERDGRTLWRLQAGAMDEARAREVCAALGSGGEACFVVRD